ncbi:hypothetical protein PAMP_003760 [Pampus punctatissimus]
MSAQGLLRDVFSFSLSPKTISNRRLRQTRSLDSAPMRHYEAEETLYKLDSGYSYEHGNIGYLEHFVWSQMSSDNLSITTV